MQFKTAFILSRPWVAYMGLWGAEGRPASGLGVDCGATVTSLMRSCWRLRPIGWSSGGLARPQVRGQLYPQQVRKLLIIYPVSWLLLDRIWDRGGEIVGEGFVGGEIVILSFGQDAELCQELGKPWLEPSSNPNPRLLPVRGTANSDCL